jgi:molybdate transport system substrate-binding protein
MTRLLAALVLAAAAASGCSPGPPAPSQGADSGLGQVTVFAASSLTESFGERGRRHERQRPGTSVSFNFASSSDLAVQITQGAPADVFASADPRQMEVVADAGLASEPVRFASNRLVIIVPRGNPARIRRPRDLARPGIVLVLAAPAVPAGSYARTALERLGIAPEAEANVVSNEEDVKAVVTKVALGEADAGIAYVTDVTGDVALDVEVIHFPRAAQVVAHYPITTLAEAPNPAGAGAFFELVSSEEGQRVLSSYGFGPP